MDIQEIRRNNLVAHIKNKHQGNRAAFCRATGKNPNLINLVLSDNLEFRRGFGEKLARDIESRAGLQEGWLDRLHGHGESRLVRIPIVRCGDIAEKPPTNYETYSVFALDRHMLRAESAPTNVVICMNENDNMSPTVNLGDWLYIDLGVKSIVADGLYVLRLMNSNETTLRRVQRLPNDQLRISVDNSLYQPIVGGECEILKDSKIMGKVIQLTRRVHI